MKMSSSAYVYHCVLFEVPFPYARSIVLFYAYCESGHTNCEATTRIPQVFRLDDESDSNSNGRVTEWYVAVYRVPATVILSADLNYYISTFVFFRRIGRVSESETREGDSSVFGVKCLILARPKRTKSLERSSSFKRTRLLLTLPFLR